MHFSTYPVGANWHIMAPGVESENIVYLVAKTMQVRRAKVRLVLLLYKVTCQVIALDTLAYLSTKTSYYKLSYFHQTIPVWNALSASVVEAPTLDQFKSRLAKYEIPTRLL